VKSRRSASLRPRTADADRVVKSVCPCCAVGCAQNVFVKDDKVVQIEGDPDAPHSRGRLCPKGSASLQFMTGSSRERHVLYRRPHGTDWEQLDLETAMDMIADRIVATRRQRREWEHDGSRTRHCTSIAALGGATLDNEENYLAPIGQHESNFQRDDDSFRWLMSSDVCKHCTHAACLDVCPTGAIFRTVERRLGPGAEAARTGTAGKRLKAAELLTAAGAIGGATVARRSRLGAVATGAALLVGSALSRFGLFAAGMASARDPKYAVEPQRRRLAERAAR
jgi:formate dehydrogenase major subunit